MSDAPPFYRVLVQGGGVIIDLDGSRHAGFYRLVTIAAADVELAKERAVALCADELRRKLGDSAMRRATLIALEAEETRSIPDTQPGFTWYHE